MVISIPSNVVWRSTIGLFSECRQSEFEETGTTDDRDVFPPLLTVMQRQNFF
jgi:hypothetical protein